MSKVLYLSLFAVLFLSVLAAHGMRRDNNNGKSSKGEEMMLSSHTSVSKESGVKSKLDCPSIHPPPAINL